MGTARVYGGGSAVLDMMMHVWGEPALRRVIHHYLKHHMYKNVETNDLFQSFQDTLGISPDWFFDQWLYRGGYPHYEVSYSDANVDGKRMTQVVVAQIHHQDELTKTFKMPIDFEVYYTDGTKSSVREWIQDRRQIVSIPNPGKKIAFVLFDAGSNVVKKVMFKKSFDELAAQALGAENMIDRYDAIVALKNDSSDAKKKRDLLVRLYNKETFYATKSEIIAQLADDRSLEARAVIRRAIADPAIEVRNAVIGAYRYIPADMESDFRALLKDSSYNMIVNTLEKMCESFPQNKQLYLDITKNEEGASMKCRIKWLEISAGMGNADALAELVNYCSISYEFITRQNAMQALQRLNYLDNAVLANLLDAYFSTNNRLAGTAYNVLTAFYTQTKYRDMIFQYCSARKWEPWQSELLKNIIK